MGRLITKILRHSLERAASLATRVHRIRFLWEVRQVWGGTVTIEPGCRMDVPVRGIGSCGDIRIGARASFGYRLAAMQGDGRVFLQAREKTARIVIGADCMFSNNVTIGARSEVTIGDLLLCGDRVSIVDSDYHVVSPEHRRDGPGESAPVHIGNNVWLGSNVMILKGVIIGDHSIVAPGSVVTREVPPRTIVGGIPAKPIKAI